MGFGSVQVGVSNKGRKAFSVQEGPEEGLALAQALHKVSFLASKYPGCDETRKTRFAIKTMIPP